MPYVNQRWLGGTLTNFRTIRQRIDKLHEFETQRELGTFDLLTKREQLTIEREIAKMNERFWRVKQMAVLPDLVFVVDVRRERNAVEEANKLNIPIVAVVDTNCDPWPIDYIIQATMTLSGDQADCLQACRCCARGQQLRKDQGIEQEEITEEDRRYLGEATLAKIRSGVLEFDAADQEYEIEYEDEDVLEYESGVEYEEDDNADADADQQDVAQGSEQA